MSSSTAPRVPRHPAGRRLYGEIDPRWRERFRSISVAATVIVGAGGALALIGRAIHIPVLAQWVDRPEVRPMQPATGAFLFLAAFAVWAALIQPGRRVRQAGLVVGALVAAGGVFVIIANAADIPFPHWLLTSLEVEDIIGGELAGRPAVNVGVVTLAMGASVILMASAASLAHYVGQLTATVTAMIGATVVVAFAYGDETLRGFPFGSGRMPVSAALLVIVFCLAVVAAKPGLGLMAAVISPWPGGIVLRRLLPLVVAGPPAGVAFLLSAITPATQPRWLALTAVIVSGLLMAALFATATAVSRSQYSLEMAEDLTDRATTAVQRDAGVVDLLLSRLSRYRSSVEGLEIATRFRPAEGWLGGDSVLTVRLGEGRLAVALIDVVGHGPHPALTAVRLGDVVEHSLRSGWGPAGAVSGAKWVLDEPHSMATIAIMEIDAGTGIARHAGAGSPPIIHMRSGQITSFRPTGPVLMADDDGEWEESEAKIDHGDVVLMYSDGLFDPSNPESAPVASGEDLARILIRCPFTDVERVADWCYDEAVGKAGGVVRDDASLIVIRRP
ncbi:MAG: PP2C family protein-serine/threonine phosphatase [Acidimicrobiia bacterium]